MTERESFEGRFHAAMRGYVGHLSSDLDAAAFVHRIAIAEPRRRGLATTLGWHPVAVPRMAWVVVLILLLAATVSAVVVGSLLLRQQHRQTEVVPLSLDQLEGLAPAADGSFWATTWLGVVHWDLAGGRATLYDTSDGLGERGSGDGDHVAVAPDGTVWATGDTWVAHFAGTWTLYPGFEQVRGLAIAPDGTVWVSDISRLRRFRGTWTVVDLPESVAAIADLHVAPDGSVWASGEVWSQAGDVSPEGGTVSYDGASWRTYTKASAGLGRELWLAGIGRDGSTWVNQPSHGCPACGTGPAGVARYDGTRWTAYPVADLLPPGLATPAADQIRVPDDLGVTVGPDGAVWAFYKPAGVVSRFDGGRWTITEVPELSGAGQFAFGPDGAPWFESEDAFLRYDGSTVARVDYRLPMVEVDSAVATFRPALVAGPMVTPSAIGTITWRVYAVGSAGYGRRPVSSAHGLAMLDGTDLRWLASDGSWPGTFLPIAADGVQALGDGLVAFGGTHVVRLSWDGSRWVVDDRLDLPRALESVHFVAGPRGTVAMGWIRQTSSPECAVAYSSDGTHFAMAARPPDGEGCEVFATGDGFVAQVPTEAGHTYPDRDGDGSVWFSADGSTWVLEAATSPFGPGSSISSIASRDGRHVAVGSSTGTPVFGPAVWVSDDGLRWEWFAGPEQQRERAVTVAAGQAGWMAVGLKGAAWVSADGRMWEQLEGWPALTEYGGAFDVAQVIAFGPGVVAVRGRLPMRGEQAPGIEAIAIGTITP